MADRGTIIADGGTSIADRSTIMADGDNFFDVLDLSKAVAVFYLQNTL